MSTPNPTQPAAQSVGSPPVASGLTSQEAEARLGQFGPNDPAPSKHQSVVVDFLRLFLNPLVLILLIAALLSAFLGDAADSAIITVIVLLSTALDFTQTYQSRRAIEQLRQQVAPTATVLRDAKWQEIRRSNVVPGDVVRLSAGDLVPADARLLESRDLFILQASLTGESLPVEKQARGEEVSAKPDAGNMVFMGTSVVSGTASALVVATGAKTSFGDIATRLAGRPEQTAFDRGLKDFSLLLTRTVLFLVIFLVVISLARHRDPFQSLLFAVALAVGLTPEFLPMIVSVTLSKGARAMAKKKVIVKHLSAIQNFGGIDVLCSDKTGTLTSGNMKLDRSLGPFGEPSERALALAYSNSKFETGIRSPLDVAILQNPEPVGTAAYEKRDEIPYDFERRRLSIVVERQSQRLLITKGAPEGILARSVTYESDGRTGPLDSAALERCRVTYEELSRPDAKGTSAPTSAALPPRLRASGAACAQTGAELRLARARGPMDDNPTCRPLLSEGSSRDAPAQGGFDQPR
ncbi:MAG: HAD-IC family P-type ATPase [Bryobacteraceae bacterium]